jgi:hypothetical protein
MTSSVGMLKFPIYGQNKSPVPNHLADYVFCIGTIIHGYSWIHGYSKIASILLI